VSALINELDVLLLLKVESTRNLLKIQYLLTPIAKMTRKNAGLEKGENEMDGLILGVTMPPKKW